MFLRKELTLIQAQVQLETMYYPKLMSGIQQLCMDAMVLAAGDEKELRFLDMLGELQSEVSMMHQMDIHVFMPKLLSIEEKQTMDKNDYSNIIISLERVTSKRNKVVKLTLDIKQLCNNFMAIRTWSSSKLRSCESLFSFYQSLVEFVNFQELSVVPTIIEAIDQKRYNTSLV